MLGKYASCFVLYCLLPQTRAWSTARVRVPALGGKTIDSHAMRQARVGFSASGSFLDRGGVLRFAYFLPCAPPLANRLSSNTPGETKIDLRSIVFAGSTSSTVKNWGERV